LLAFVQTTIVSEAPPPRSPLVARRGAPVLRGLDVIPRADPARQARPGSGMRDCPLPGRWCNKPRQLIRRPSNCLHSWRIFLSPE
jgi:hypothetical protein